ncbi:hypothetical protein jhhlp_006898 [Lomentospora prolificans]|uniref:SET domain-containing protein n=1 Tax=Lomentospora prolificans TaxID=41688 RepID=A0A2N3N330_9PEZI|nr:hypothetical protein jhhlp_006898 [Lomentospora prolificans]
MDLWADDNATLVYSDLLSRREGLTEKLRENPYDILIYLERATVHRNLDYPDLAVGDAYRALLLSDDVKDDAAEYHEQATEAFKVYIDKFFPNISDPVACEKVGQNALVKMACICSLRAYYLLAAGLCQVGCLKSAYEFSERGFALEPRQEFKDIQERILQIGRLRLKREDITGDDLPDWGLARREIYPWNDHEADRYSKDTLDFLNSKLREMAPKCSVKATELPVLAEGTVTDGSKMETCLQLGLFADEDIAPGEAVLKEYSLLTANNRFKDLLCDACGEELPRLGDSNGESINCPECYDTVFCSPFCFEQAQEKYHPAVCEKEVDSIGKDPKHREADERLHMLLLARVLAMSACQEVHPLDILEVKYIWGDFVPCMQSVRTERDTTPPSSWTLPFSFEYNVKMPLHFLEKMDYDIYSHLDEYDVWIFNTLYAKFRGTASARKNPRDGRPEVAAVHPFWCLANHDCDPNVTWEWGGRMTLWAREKRIVGELEGGIRKGEEILNHYCDLRLPVKDRREWMLGSLGGLCMCKRCKTEALL